MARFQILVCLLMAVMSGCKPTSKVSNSPNDSGEKPKEIKVNGPLRVIIVEDPNFAKLLQLEWSATSEYEIEIRNETEESVQETLASDSPQFDADAIVGPAMLTGQLASKNQVRSLPPEITERNSESAYRVGDVFSGLLRKELRWEKRQFAVSFGSPTLLLLTRSDLVATPPATWDELHETVAKLKSENGLPVGVGTFSQPLANGWAAKTFLARSAPYMHDPSIISTYFNYTTMEPRIAEAPFVRALQEMKRDFSESDLQLTPSNVFAQFMDGKTAIAVCWPTNKLDANQNSEALSFPIVISELPGTKEFYSASSEDWRPFENPNQIRNATLMGLAGKTGVITRSAKNAQLAGIFLGWATSPEQSSQLCTRALDSAPFRNSQNVAAKNWCDSRLNGATASNYFDALKTATNRSESFVAPRIPGVATYMAVLDEAVLRVLRGETQPEVALNGVSDKWKTITVDLGVEKQLEAYRHSIGISND